MTERNQPNDEFIEKLIIKGITQDKTFSVLCTDKFEKDYFIVDSAGKIFEEIKNHLTEFKQIPPREILVNTLGDEIKEYFADVDSVDFDVSHNYEYLKDIANSYLKDAAIKKALMDSVELVNSSNDIGTIRKIIEDALCKDLKTDLGIEYFSTLGERLKKIFTTTETRVPTYFPAFDEKISGGFPPLTLSVIVAKIHGFKSNTMANFAGRQVLHGKNVIIMTLEMSEVMFSQRFDSIFSLKDINQMYFSSNRSDLISKLKNVKNSPHGNLHIKQFPTGAASVNNFKSYLREMRMHGQEFDIIYVDYINLMKPAITEGDNLYSKVKTIAEELRALSFEFEVPVVSVSQLNREGSFAGFKDVNFNYIAESHGVPATADFMSIFGTDPDALIYESELHNKIVKNRFGPVGDILKMFYDSRNLKMYDQEEEDLWMEDAQLSGDERNPAPPPPEPENTRRGRRR